MMPGQMMPGQGMPGQMMPAQMMPGQTMPALPLSLPFPSLPSFLELLREASPMLFWGGPLNPNICLLTSKSPLQNLLTTDPHIKILTSDPHTKRRHTHISRILTSKEDTSVAVTRS
jgi:hypothetical protein